jgi:hypothetical protein
MNLKNIARLFTLAGLLAVLIAEPSLALDGKTYPGAMCQPRSPESNFVRRGSYINPNTEAASVICPVVRDTVGSTFLHSANVYVLDRSTEANVTCTLFSASFDGKTVATSFNTSSGFSDQVKRIQLNGSNGASGASLAAPASGHYFIECRLPGVDLDNGGLEDIASAIVSYRVYEND